MSQIGIGDTYHDFLFVKDCLDNDPEHFSNLAAIESRYLDGDTIGYEQNLSRAESTVNWRYRIARWMLRVADEFLLKRDTALIALHYFDRMMMAKKELKRDDFQVAAITCLFVGSKIFQKRPLKLSTLLLYTKNAFSRESILSMEQEILRNNSSHFFPVTSSTFVHVLLFDLPASESPQCISSMIENCQFMIELAACDLFFVAHRASHIAVAAILVTLETQTVLRAKLSPEGATSLLLSIKAKIDYTTDSAVIDCINKLRSIHTRNTQQIKDMEDKSTDDEVAKYTAGKESEPGSRVATPSPTDPCQCNIDSSPPIIVDEEQKYSNGSRKRRRRSIQSEIEIV